MTAPEPLALTLEEAAQLLGEQGLVLILDGASGAASRWSVRPWSAPRDWMKEELGATWPEVVGAARGRPVVARDEAAELRAENERLRADLFEYVLDGFVQGAHRQDDGGYNTGGISTYRDLGNWLVEHAHWTRRPGGRGRNQVYDPPKADAASEGQS